MISYLRSSALKHTLVLIGILLLSNGVFAQLDSVSISSVSFTEEIVTDSISNTTDTLDIMSVNVYIDDIDFMGEVLVTVYQLSTDFPLSTVKQTKTELESYGLINGSVATLEILGIEPEVGSYDIDVQVRNYQGANLPIVNTQY